MHDAYHANLLEHSLDCVFCACGDAGPGVGVEINVPLQDGVKDLLLCLSPEGWHTAEQDVQYHATAPNVCLRPIMPLQNLLQQPLLCLGSSYTG